MIIVKIKPNGNDDDIDGDQLVLAKQQLLKIYEEIKNFQNVVEYIEVADSSDMMQKIIVQLNLNKQIGGHTVDCYENDKYLYQICCSDEHTETKKKYNQLASILTMGKVKIYGDAFLMKFLCTNVTYPKPQKTENDFNMKQETSRNNKNYVLDKIVENDVEFIIKRRIFHVALYITEEGEVDEREFVVDPAECCLKNIGEIKMFTMKYKTDPFVIIYGNKGTQTNEKIRVLIDEHFSGDVLLCLLCNDDYKDFTKEQFEKIQ